MIASKKPSSAAPPARARAAAQQTGRAAGKTAVKAAAATAVREPQRSYQLHVQLEFVNPPVWRRLLVPAALTLGQLHDVLQCAMGWGNEHLHDFCFGCSERYASGSEFDSGDDAQAMLDEDAHDLASVLGAKGAKKFRYTYDFGDNWRHQVQVEKRLKPDPGNCRVQCLDGANACPPEDIGGPWGYQRYRQALADPGKHPDCGYPGPAAFDPAKFDLEAVNAALARLRFG